MIIIGLVGGTEAARISLTSRVLEMSPSRICSYMMTTPTEADARVAILRDVVCRLDPRSGRNSIILTHIMTAEEADFVRSSRGVIWHVQGQLSDVVPIQPTDLLVATDRAKGNYLHAADAYSESVLRRVAA